VDPYLGIDGENVQFGLGGFSLVAKCCNYPKQNGEMWIPLSSLKRKLWEAPLEVLSLTCLIRVVLPKATPTPFGYFGWLFLVEI
jgi:hypothetical protein